MGYDINYFHQPKISQFRSQNSVMFVAKTCSSFGILTKYIPDEPHCTPFVTPCFSS